MDRGLALVAGALWGGWIGPPDHLVGLVAFVALVVAGRWARRRVRRMLVGAALGVVGSVWGGVVAPPPALVGSPEGRLRLEGRTVEVRCRQVDRCTVWLDEVEAEGTPLRGMVPLWTDGDARIRLRPGDRVAAWAEVRGRAVDSNPGVRAPWQRRRLRWRARARLDRPLEVTRADGAALLRVRLALRRTLTLPGEEVTSLYRALLLGDRTRLSRDLREAFVDSGTVHLLAISGLHLAVIGWGLYRVLLAVLLRVRPWAQARRLPAWAAVGAAAWCWAYVLAIAPSQATLRAAVALTVVLGGAALARRARSKRALVVAAGALLLADPRAVGTASFQLSFAAAGSLVLGVPRLRPVLDWLDEPGTLPGPRWRAVAKALVGAVAVCALTFAATAPLGLAWFGQLAPAGLVTNLVAVPLVSLLVVPAGFLWLLLALATPTLAAWVAPVPTVAAGWLLDLAEAWAEIAGPATRAAIPHAAGVAGAVAVVAALGGRRARRLAVGCAALAVAVGVASGASRGALSLTALDVGHGDALLLRTPEGGAVLVDTGGHHMDRAEQALAHRRLVPALTRLGVDRLDLLVVTHADRDHVGAGARLARRIPVGTLWLPPCGTRTRSVERLARRVALDGGTVQEVYRGRAFEWAGARFRVLWPPSGAAGRGRRCRAGRNDAGVVLSVEHGGRRLLLAADVERRAEAALVAREGADGLRADVLKVAHHGSRTSSTDRFMAAVRPRAAVVSGAWKPGPMPPHPSVPARMQRAGVAVWITGRDGAVTIHVGPDGALRVSDARGLSWSQEAAEGELPGVRE
ncbi:MAG: DNA internalization-related competence protein ComEC/Rec2 [Myxococcota bacterium]